jgi:uncharacterized protein YgbK (DUF1537 family)
VPPAVEPIAILDDDPTGVQTLSGARVILDWAEPRVEDALASARAVHLLTNSRAYPPDEAAAIVRSAAAAVLSTAPNTSLVLRGDSTLRGHVLEEYLAVRDAKGTESFPPLVLAPALPSAGRVTVGGVQYLDRDGRRVPVHETEYATDPAFAYASSRLLDWAEQRTGGLFKSALGIEVTLEALHRGGPDAVVAALRQAAESPVPCAVALDAETGDDVEAVAAGLQRATAAGVESVVRCGPAVAGALGGVTAMRAASLPVAQQLLLVCGSYVSQSVRQLERVTARFPASLVAVDPQRLGRGADGTQIAAQLEERLDASRLAVLAVWGPPPSGSSDLAAGRRIAEGLASVVAAVQRRDALVVLKGGVTSAVVLRHGLGATEADIVGPVLPGVALWTIIDPVTRPVLVVPGNVGGDGLLVQIVDGVLRP